MSFQSGKSSGARKIRALFSEFRIEEVTTRYSANAKATRLVGELIISD